MGCATQGAFLFDRYVETGGSGVALLESKELRLHPDHRFEYVKWTDMVEAQPLPGLPASDSVAVLVTLRQGQEVAAGLTLLAVDETGWVLVGTASNAVGQARLAVARTHPPRRFTVHGIDFQTEEQPWPRTSTAYAVRLSEKLGPAAPAGKVLAFRILEQTVARLVLQQGTDTLVLAASTRP